MASRLPVEAPDGTAARPSTPDSSSTSASTVGIAARVQNFARNHIDDCTHVLIFPCLV